MRTLVGDPGLAIGTRPARSARTGVRALASIEASGSVLAGPVVGAVVQVLIAKEAAPAFLAMASPGLVAGSMLATRIPDTVGAECSGPTIPAPLKREKCVKTKKKMVVLLYRGNDAAGQYPEFVVNFATKHGNDYLLLWWERKSLKN